MADKSKTNIEKLRDLVKDVRVGMLTTQSTDGKLHSRPMFTYETDFDGDLWFMTGSDTSKAREINYDKDVNIAYSEPAKNLYISVSGKAQLINDRARIKKIWNPLLKAWFEGPDDPTIRLLKISVSEAEYWDAPSGPLATVLTFARAVTGGEVEVGENETLKIK